MTKAHILHEIKRTAQENGGIPLGQDRFESETGIRRADWYGKHWARWGDALREAGFAPNELQGAYDKTKLLDEYARFARELGRLPSAGDLKLQGHGHPGFPSHNTFAARLGSKSELVGQVLEFCRSRSDYEDVARMCEQYALRNQEAVVESEPSQEQAIGSVYLVRSGRFYKIGKSNAAGRREYELAIQLPEKAKMIHAIRTDDPSGIEAYWHNRFAAKRKNGEWFELTTTDVAIFKRRRFM